MKKEVIISICGGHSADPDPITLVTSGSYYRKGGKTYVSYEESELTGLKGTSTMLTIDENMVMISRIGLYPSQLLLEKGKRHHSLYHTDEGDLAISVSTQSIDWQPRKVGGTLDVRYSLEIEHAHAGNSVLKVDITDAGENPTLELKGQ